MSPAQRGARLLRAVGAEPRLVGNLVAEVRRWQPWGALDEEDLWAIAATTVWELRGTRADVTVAYVRTRVRWRVLRALDAERREHGWRLPRGGAWEPPHPRMRFPEWDWGRPFRKR